jgi:hypothetical protein
MPNFLAFFHQLLARLSQAKPVNPPQVRCEYCGRAGHVLADCPNAAKFHAFSVDHEAEEDEWENNVNSS